MRGRSTLLLAIGLAPLLAGWTPQIGEAPSGSPGTKTAFAQTARTWQSGLTVDVASREASRTFFRAIYQASEGVPIGFTGNVDTGVAGTTSVAFRDATVLRVNWYRAMAGIPADITMKDEYSQKAQKAALIMAANGQLSHYPPKTWTHYSDEGAEAAGKSNLGLADNGPDTISSYILDPGGSNYYVGHRRWILYANTTQMGTGDVPKQGSYHAANALWVVDSNASSTRPATRDAYVAWPPRGYVPYYTIFPRWSFGVPKSDMTNAVVTMTSKGMPIAVKQETPKGGTGDPTLVWVPAGYSGDGWGVMPRPSSDTTYDITITNVIVEGTPRTFTYSVIAYDPTVAGPDTVVPMIAGPDKAQIGSPTAYAFNALPRADGYRWQEARIAPLTLAEGAEGPTTAFTAETTAGYAWISGDAAASGSRSFHLAHPQPKLQALNLERVVFANASTTLSFKSRLQWAAKGQVPKVQARVEGSGVWSDVWTQPAAGDVTNEKSFNAVQVPLGAFAGKGVRIRFVYEQGSGSFYPQTTNGGWYFDDVTISAGEELLTPIDREVAAGATAFSLVPTSAGRIALRVRPRYYGKYYLDWGPARVVEGSATAGPQTTPPIPPTVPTIPPTVPPTTPTAPPTTPTKPPPPPPTPPTKPPPTTPPVIAIPDLGTPPPFPGMPPVPISIPGFPWKP